MYKQDTIAAIATPAGKGAIAIIRLSGSNLRNIYSDLTKKSNYEDRRASYLPIYGHNGLILDKCMVIFIKGPNSYTGEDIIEINCHGGNLVPKILLSEILRFDNVRLANNGEFTRRSFLNGRIDLTQAESISALIESETEIIKEINLRNSDGFISEKIQLVNKNLFDLLTIIEHELDFNDQEVKHITLLEIQKKLISINDDLQLMVQSSLYINQLGDGFIVVICGRPNVGKSSLFNVLSGQNRTIVSKQKGTTRDSVEIPLNIQGKKIILVDTAGYMVVDDYINQASVKRTHLEIERADIVLLLDDIDPEKELQNINIENQKIILVKTKQDKIDDQPVHCNKYIEISSKNIKGISLLINQISTVLSTYFPDNYIKNPIITSRRQGDLIKNAIGLIAEILESLQGGLDMVIVASLLGRVNDILSEVTGKIYSDDILDNIFNEFCVGK